MWTLNQTAKGCGNKRVLYILTEDDAHDVARQLGHKRKLTYDQLKRVEKGVEWGLGECWHDVMEAAVEEALREGRKP